MRYIYLVLSLMTGLFIANVARSQQQVYRDATLGPILKIRPMSMVPAHFTGGVEIPLAKSAYLDLEVGTPIERSNSYASDPGGVLASAGLKLPLIFSSPYSMIYWMPQVAFSRTKEADVYCSGCTFGSPEVRWISTKRAMLGIGYRHIMPRLGLYYDVGFELGFGTTTSKLSDFSQYGVTILAGTETNDGISGVMMAGHLSIGYSLRIKKRS